MASTALDIIFRVIDKTSGPINALKRNLTEVNSAVGSFAGELGQNLQVLDRHGQAVSGVGNRITELGGKFQGTGQSLALGFTVPLVASAAVLTQFDRSAAKLQIGEAFERTTERVGVSAEEMAAALDKAAGGTISSLDLMQAANRAMILGVADNVGDFVQLMEIARDRARGFGLSVTQAFNDLTLGIGRQSRLILDNLGIIVRIEDANKVYAATLGKTVKELTDVERRQGFLNAVLAQGEETIDRNALAVRTSSEAYLAQRAEIDNLINTVQNIALPVLTRFLAVFNALPATVKGGAVAFAGILLVLGPLLSALGAVLRMIGQNVTIVQKLVVAYRAAAVSITLAAAAQGHYTRATTAAIVASNTQVVAQGRLAGSLGLMIARIGLLRLTLIGGAVIGFGRFATSIQQGASVLDSAREVVSLFTLGFAKDLPLIGDALRTAGDRAKEESDRIVKVITDLRDKNKELVDDLKSDLEGFGDLRFPTGATDKVVEAVRKLAAADQEFKATQSVESLAAFADGLEDIADVVPPHILLQVLIEMGPEIENNWRLARQLGIAWVVAGDDIGTAEKAMIALTGSFDDAAASARSMFSGLTAAINVGNVIVGIPTQRELELDLQGLNLELAKQNRIIELGGKIRSDAVPAEEREISLAEKQRDAVDRQIRELDILIREKELFAKSLIPQALLDEVEALERGADVLQLQVNVLDRAINAIDRQARSIQREITLIERKARALERQNRPLERNIRLIDIQRRQIELASRGARRRLEDLRKIPGISGDVIRAAEKEVKVFDDQIDVLTDVADAIQLQVDIRQLQIDLINDSTFALEDQLEALDDSAFALENERDIINDNISATRDLIQKRRDFIATLAPRALLKEIEDLRKVKDQLGLQRDKLNQLIPVRNRLRRSLGSMLDPFIAKTNISIARLAAVRRSIELTKRIGAINIAIGARIAPSLAVSLALLNVISRISGTKLERFFQLFSAGSGGIFSLFNAAFNVGLDLRPFLRGLGIPGFQHGGIVRRPTFALLGEAGPEAVIPLNRGLPPGLAAPNITVIVEGNTTEDTIDEIVAAVRRSVR